MRGWHLSALAVGALIGVAIDRFLPDSLVKVLAYAGAYGLPLLLIPYIPARIDQVWLMSGQSRVQVTTDLTPAEAKRAGIGLSIVYFVVGGLAGACGHILWRAYA